MLELQAVHKSFGDRDVLHDISFHVAERERVALVGPNGVGKSSLLRTILGELALDSGVCRLAPWATAAYLPQNACCAGNVPLEVELRCAFKPLQDIEEKQRALEAKMRGLPPHDPALMPLVAEHSRLHDELERLGGYTVETEIGKVLAGLGFQTADRDKRVCDFSGGWQMRIALAKLLLQHPSLLLLDEPTNHLDLAAVAWLEEHLRESRSAVIVVSHDRYFLDRVTQRTLELADGRVRDWAGNYSYYVAEKGKKERAQEAAYKRQQEYVARQEAFVERFRASARRSAQAKSRERAIEKIELVEAPRKDFTTRFRFPAHRPSGREVFTLKGVTKAYDGRLVFGPVDLLIEKGDKIALLGENGAGKTTMLRLMAGVEHPDRGVLRVGLNVQRGYYAQHQAETLDLSKCVLDEVYRAAPPDWLVGDVRNLLARFGVRADDVFKMISVLSGGERSRVALAKMLLRPANVLLLDEPTNHLDISAREMLEDALRAYEGTVVLVSHDRYLIDKVVTRVVEFSGPNLNIYPGNYSSYLIRKAKEAEIAAAAPPIPQISSEVIHRPRRRLPARAEASPAKQLAAVEAEIAILEATIRELAQQMALPVTAEDQPRAQALLQRYTAVEARLADLNERWEHLARLVEEASAERQRITG